MLVPVYFLLLAILISMSLSFEEFSKKPRPKLFLWAVFVNLFAVFFAIFFAALVFSGGGYEAWIFKRNFLWIPLLGIVAMNLVSYFLLILFAILWGFRWKEHHTWGLFIYLLLTVFHAMVAFCWMAWCCGQME